MADFNFTINGDSYKIVADDEAAAIEMAKGFKVKLDNEIVPPAPTEAVRPKEEMSTAEDSVRAFFSGIPKGIMGLTSMPTTFGEWAIDSIADKIGDEYSISTPENRITKGFDYESQKGYFNKGLKAVTGTQLHDATTRVGKAFGVAGEFAGGAVLPGAGLFSTVAKGAKLVGAAGKAKAASSAYQAAQKAQAAKNAALKLANSRAAQIAKAGGTQVAKTGAARFAGTQVAKTGAAQAAKVPKGLTPATAKALSNQTLTAGAHAAAKKEFGSAAARLGTSTVAPYVTQEAAGQAFYGTSYEPIARLVGGVAGGAMPAIVNKAFSPFAVTNQGPKASVGQNKSRILDPKETLDRVLDMGVNPTPGLLSRNPLLRNLERQVARTAGGADPTLAVKQQVTSAFLNKAGPKGHGIKIAPEDVNPANVRNAIADQYDALGLLFKEMGKIVKINRTKETAKIFQRLDERMKSFLETTFSEGQGLKLQGTMRTFTDNWLKGKFDGEQYAIIHKRLREGYRDSKGDIDVNNTYKAMLDGLDEMIEASSGGRGNKLANGVTFAQLRQGYKDLVTVDEAFRKAGGQKYGYILPADLAFPVKKRAKQTRHGRGDLAEAAEDIGMYFEDYGSGGNNPVLQSSLGGLAGAVLSGGNPWVAGATAAGAVAGPLAASHAYARPGVQRWLTNQSGADMQQLLRLARRRGDAVKNAGLVQGGVHETQHSKDDRRKP